MTARAGRDAPRGLREMQHLMRALITAPAGVQGTLDRARDRSGWLGDFDDPRAELGRTVVGDARLDRVERLGVYAHAYFTRLRDVLADDHPVVVEIVGDDAFSDLASAYLAAHPSTSPTLRDLGRSFADFLAAHPLGGFARARWPGLADVARLEWAFTDVFDAADEAPLTREALAGLAPERWAELELAPVASFRVLSFEWPVSATVRAIRRGEAPTSGIGVFVDGPPEDVAVWRADERAVFRALDAAERDALAHVMRRERFGDLCERLADAGADADQAAAEAARLLAAWVDAGWLAAPST